ncbi:DUF1043 family protein [Glaciecola sp. XM2]|uniref:ZapG family protein n=1 Tax=Glaciecola sp. XM2 TaxID=1914931 RepID=UPI001BDE8655|nr:DUF1043 family protein [Glaciecola sp. XM2]MBT1452470.1 DUF1043 family protein [Glaciecola sp. XM2]
MEIVSVIFGVVVGVVIGVAVAWQWANIKAKQKGADLVRSEQELKTILAQQAHHHIESSKESIDAIRLRLEQLTNNLQTYEASLSIANEETDKASFFGEHARMYLRNHTPVSSSSDSANQGDAPPRDFANNGSGLFVGNISNQKSANK